METHVSLALEIVTAQAKVRMMGEEEIRSMVASLSAVIRSMEQAPGLVEDFPAGTSASAKKAVRERTITCLESGKSFKMITRRHLAKYGLTPDDYRAKWGYAKGTPLVCKSLQRLRRKKMQEMRLWERRTQDQSAA
ncbi:transcriptional regulator [Desulfovibrio aerotolerans]|uniref:Transcriptional regulator n=1 Tax=Solidesulfovibrio aerotolerans TaxID=295255 RepID=A0A7C9N2E3_9BACT|nr:MucR family transcriptional regulator [Solidesulfovibrio aerotolerans]MYL83771.1 transcriptional regulator [Solidesulfovibrio aerotolerans]